MFVPNPWINFCLFIRETLVVRRKAKCFGAVLFLHGMASIDGNALVITGFSRGNGLSAHFIHWTFPDPIVVGMVALCTELW